MGFIFDHSITNITPSTIFVVWTNAWVNEWIKLLLTFNSLVTTPIIFKTKPYLVPVNTAFHNQSSLALQLSSHLGGAGTLCSSRGQLTDSPEHPFFPPASLTWTHYSRLSWGSLPLHVGLMRSWAPGNVLGQKGPSSQCFCGTLCCLPLSPFTLKCKPNHLQRACGGQGPGLATGKINISLLTECLLSVK